MKTDRLLLAVLLLLAFLPRLILALQLDMVTDEEVYILGGKIYTSLLRHLHLRDVNWQYNYEHPALVKIVFGLMLDLNGLYGHPLTELLAARLPSVLSGTLLVGGIYWLGRAPFGRNVAALAALTLAVSPWLVYFSGLAYLDMTMTLLITLAYLLFWHALTRPWLAPICAILLGLGIASKYTAVLALPAVLLFGGYYLLLLRPRLPPEQRLPLRWRWWALALVLLPLSTLLADPIIWTNPLPLALESINFQLKHAEQGHLFFLAGQASPYAPAWSMLFILLSKLSLLVTMPALLFVLIACVRLLRFHRSSTQQISRELLATAFLLCWLLSLLATFSLLSIVVGTHYALPLTPPVALAGASGLALLARRSALGRASHSQLVPIFTEQSMARSRLGSGGILLLLALLIAGSHLYGLLTVHAAEGYTSELFRSEDSIVQVAYPGYREAGNWLLAHAKPGSSVGLIALENTLHGGIQDVSWYNYNRQLATRFTLTEAHPDDYNLSYDYLIWPMHLIQRGYRIPAAWQGHIVYTVKGGGTTYCYVLARAPGALHTD